MGLRYFLLSLTHQRENIVQFWKHLKKPESGIFLPVPCYQTNIWAYITDTQGTDELHVE